MFVNKHPFLDTISKNIKFSTAAHISNQSHPTIIKAILDVRAIFMKRVFIITTMLMDGQFENLIGDLAGYGITLNTVARDEHVPEVERHIRTIKERAQCVYNTLPFEKLPSRVMIELIYYSVFWLNSFPSRDGISDALSPRATVTGSHIDYNKHCKLEFGSDKQAHKKHDNTMASRTTGAFALRPTGNTQDNDEEDNDQEEDDDYIPDVDDTDDDDDNDNNASYQSNDDMDDNDDLAAHIAGGDDAYEPNEPMADGYKPQIPPAPSISPPNVPTPIDWPNNDIDTTADVMTTANNDNDDINALADDEAGDNLEPNDEIETDVET